MGTTQMIRPRRDWLNPPSPDPKDVEQWVPRVAWVTTATGSGSNDHIGSARCVHCGNASVRSIRPSKRMRKRLGMLSYHFEPPPDEKRSGFIGYETCYAPDGLCEYCHSKGVSIKHAESVRNEKFQILTGIQRSKKLSKEKKSLKGWLNNPIQKKKRPGDRGKLWCPPKSSGLVKTK